jgi:penicillin-binding protein 1A
MSRLPPPALRVAVFVVALAILLSPSVVTLWLSTPAVTDVQERVTALTAAYGVVLLTPDQLPPVLVKAVVATEDERFFSHHGIDTLGLGRAVLYDITNRCLCQGGSTITEQLVKELYLRGSDRGSNKPVDMVLALKVELVIGKLQILADYLSEIPTGYGRYGVSDAACAYFHKGIGNLTLGQYALLAGVTQAPSVYDPTVNPELARERRAQVLAAMVSERYITDADAAAARQEPVLADGAAPASCPAV